MPPAATLMSPVMDSLSGNGSPSPASMLPCPQLDVTHNAVHLIHTSLLGKHLYEYRIAPNATLPIIIQPISGSQTDSMLDLLIQEDTPCTLVSILVGGNDIENGSTVTAYLENFENIIFISTIRSKNRHSTVNIIEIPEISVPTKINENICELNQLLFNLCNSPITLFFFCNDVINGNSQMFVQDHTHLSFLGTTKLPMTFLHVILKCESTWRKELSSNEPSQG